MDFKNIVSDVNRSCFKKFDGFSAAGTGDDNRGDGSATGLLNTFQVSSQNQIPFLDFLAFLDEYFQMLAV